MATVRKKKEVTIGDNIEDTIAINTPKKRGRPTISKEVIDKLGDKPKKKVTANSEKVRKHKVAQQLEQLGKIRKEKEGEVVEAFREKIPEFLEQRKTEFESLLSQFEVENEVVIDKGNGKVSCQKLSNFLSQPLIKGGILVSKVSASDVTIYSDCFWECVDRANENCVYVPTIYQFCRLLGVSTEKFTSYRFSQDADLREAVFMVRDRFINYYTIKGLTNELNSIMSMFVMKAQFGLRDNDTPQMVVNNNYQTTVHTNLDEIEKRFNLTNDDSDIINMEV